MALRIGDNFNYQGQKPNFERDRFLTLAEMKEYPETSIDDGHLSYCVEDGKRYEFKSTNSIDETTGRWREFKSGLQEIPQATDISLGGIKTGYIENGANYPLQLDNEGKAFIDTSKVGNKKFLPLTGGTVSGAIYVRKGLNEIDLLPTSPYLRLIGIVNSPSDPDQIPIGTSCIIGLGIDNDGGSITIGHQDLPSTINYKGFSIRGKTSNDLLHAAGGTIPISEIQNQVIASIIDEAPETLDTLNELAAALGDDPNFATTIASQLGQKIESIDASGTSPLTLSARKNGTTITLEGSISEATTSSSGLMSAQDKQKLNGYQIDIEDLQKQIKELHYPFGANISVSPNLLEVGTSSNLVTVTWSYNNSDKYTISSQTINDASVAVGTLKSTQTPSTSSHATITYTLKASTTTGENITKSTSVAINHASYYGCVSSDKSELTESDIKALTKSLRSNKNLSVRFTQDNQKVVYAYPSYFGDLTSVKNSSGFEGLNGYTKSSVTVNGQNYNVYFQNNAATSSDTLTFN